MTDPCRPRRTTRSRSAQRPCLDEQLLSRAAEINDSVAAEFSEGAASPHQKWLLARMESLGVETGAAVSVALQRAQLIAFYMGRGQTPRDGEEGSSEARALSAEDRAQVAALAVAWWDGLLTALRAGELQRRTDKS